VKSYRKELWFQTNKRRELINITSLVEECVRESGVREGLCLVNAMHITASVFINDDEPWRNWHRKNHIPNMSTTVLKTTLTRT